MPTIPSGRQRLGGLWVEASLGKRLTRPISIYIPGGCRLEDHSLRLVPSKTKQTNKKATKQQQQKHETLLENNKSKKEKKGEGAWLNC
jgi:hypothetical protein